MKIVIIGHGFVGKAVEYGFSTKGVEAIIIDPIYETLTNARSAQIYFRYRTC